MKQLLLVEDDRDVREAMAMILAVRGYKVRQAQNGREGLELFRERGPFFAVVTDFSMPEMNGADMSIGIRALEPTVPIVMITASNTLWPLLEANGLGDVVLLHKPTKSSELLEVLRKFDEDSAAANAD